MGEGKERTGVRGYMKTEAEVGVIQPQAMSARSH